MLKMLIADDEPVIIRGLQMLIDWAQLGIEICATCENGADALREIFAQGPDLALLDISMPGKTGIEILKALHTAQSRTRVIFISGFQDFSYAHDALSYGAVDYLLKPVKKDDLLRAVEKCLPVQPDHSAPAPASDTGSYSDAFSRVAEMEPASYILTAVQTLGLNAKNTMERQLIEFSIFGQLDTLCRQTGQGTAFQKKGQCYLLLVNMTQAQATGWLHEAQALLEQRIRCKVGFVCSPATAEMSAVPTFTAPCRDACRWFYFADHLPDTVLAMDAPPFGEAPADTAALHPLQEAVAAGFIETDRKIFNRAVENLLAAVPPITDGRADAAVYHLLVCRRMVQARLERSGVQCAGGSSDLLDAARETADYPALEALFKKSLEELYGQMAGQVKKNEHKDIQKVTDYIAAHYRENLTLEVLAKHIHMNPFYFSSYFKKQLGQNFKDYLNRVRMEHALELLLNSDKRSYEIAEEVGFKDYRYFNEVFSRYYGKTPPPTARALRGKTMDNERAQWAARMLALRVNGMAVLYPAALRMKHPFPQMEKKYAKLAYCSRYAFSAARSQRTLEEAAPDSVLNFRYLGHIFVKAAPESWEMTENGTRAVWLPLPGVQVVTEIALCDGGHLRRHTVTSEITCEAFDAGFAVPDDCPGAAHSCTATAARAEHPGGFCAAEDLTGRGTPLVLEPMPNTSLQYPRTVIPMVQYAIHPGTTVLETEVTFA